MALRAPLLLFVLTVLACGPSQAPLNAATADVIVETVVRGLDTPWAMDFPQDGRFFFSERPGRIRIVECGYLFLVPDCRCLRSD